MASVGSFSGTGESLHNACSARCYCGTLMAPEVVRCPRCAGPLSEIDRFGERLVGCTECNRWTWPDSGECISLSLPQDDLISVRRRVRPIAAARFSRAFIHHLRYSVHAFAPSLEHCVDSDPRSARMNVIRSM